MRFVDRPLARAGAVVGLLGAVVALVASWPETWWPRDVPALTVAVVDDPELQPAVYASTTDLSTLSDAPPPDGPGGCWSDERHAWLRSQGGVASGWASTRVVLTTLRAGATVVVTSVRPVVTTLDGVYATALVPCPERLGTGGGYPFVRTVHLSVSDTPSVEYYGDDPDVTTPTISLYLTQGEAAELFIETEVASEVDPGTAFAWSLELNLLVDGSPQVVRIPEEGVFRIARLTEDRTYWTDVEPPRICRPGRQATDWCYAG